MNILKLKVFGTIIACIFPFIFHSLYEIFPNFITSIFLPINESIWEHMKLLFGSIMLSSVIQKVIVICKNKNINNICFSNFIASISSIPIFLILFLPIYYTLGENLVITIILMFISIIISEIISYKIIKMRDFKMDNITIILVIFVYIMFGILTYFPINNDIFIDKTNKIIGN